MLPLLGSKENGECLHPYLSGKEVGYPATVTPGGAGPQHGWQSYEFGVTRGPMSGCD